jgi:internalin A
MSAGHPEWRWRSGVVLEWNGAHALVRLDRADRRTDVSVLGGLAGDRQSLFDIIRAHLTALHGKVRAVEEIELAEHPDTWVSADKLRLLEEEGTKETVEQTKDKTLASVQVVPTLDTVESREARVADWPSAVPRQHLFISYAHEDARKIRPLSMHLTILSSRGYIQVWDDKQLIAGEEWEARIHEELDRADIVLVVYSTAARASQFIQTKEVPRVLERARQKKCAIIVLPLDRKDWDTSHPLEVELKKYQTASWNAKPVLEFRPQSKGWQEVEQAIRKAVNRRRPP